MLKLIGSPRTRTMRVIWLLEELGLDYDIDPVAPMSEAAVAATPTGKVPVLMIDGTAIADSVAVMTWLADHYGAFTHPAGTLERGRQDAMTQRICDEMDALLWMAARHSFVLPQDRRLPAIKDSLKWEFARNAARLGDTLGDAPYLAGDTPTLPDILSAHCCGWAAGAKFPLEDDRMRDHMERMRARPAYAAAQARADAVVPA